MKDKQMKDLFQQTLNAELSGLRTSSLQRDQLYQNAVGGYKVKRKLTVGWVFALVLMLFTVTAVAAVLLTHTEIIEQFAVPMALENDKNDITQETYTNEELAQLIAILSENGITLDEDTRIMKALENGEGYWEEETLMAICREAFGGMFYEWTIEQKYWFETMTVKIGFKEKNPYLIPSEGDMTIPEAKAHAVKLLKDEYGVELPTESDGQWKVCEWLYAPWTDSEGVHPAQWKFEFINRSTDETVFSVNFTHDGELLKIKGSAVLDNVPAIESFSEARNAVKSMYGSMSDWPVEAWAEYGRLITPLKAETEGDLCYQNAGFQMPPANALSTDVAVQLAKEDIQAGGETRTQIICCTPNGRTIYKITLRIHFPGNETSAKYDAIWCVELDCMTGEIIEKREYHYGSSEPLMMYVPFDVLDAYPTATIAPTEDEAARITEKDRQADAYDAYAQQYGENWFFWPLEAQKDALGENHHVPKGDEMTRDEAVEMALKAIEAKYGEEVLTQLGDYQIGVICCLDEETEGPRYSWELYFTNDTESLSNGYRVNIVVYEGVLEQPEVEVQQASIENG